MYQDPLLITKPEIPPIRPERVSRPCLFKWLNAGLPGQSDDGIRAAARLLRWVDATHQSEGDRL
jgi:hypothetical protein